MEIKTLVIIGMLFIIMSIILNTLLKRGAIMNSIKHYFDDKDFAEETKKDHENIDEKMKKELEKVQKELKDLKETKKNQENKSETKKDEVFLVSSNEFTQEHAPKVCKALFNSDIATKEQVQNSYNNGANWCNYGWVKAEDEAYYPLQKDMTEAKCKGTKGLNGGKLDGENLKLGINCFGVKPDKNNYYNLEKLYSDQPYAEEEQKMLDSYREKLNKKEINIQSFNDEAWSQYEIKKDDPATEEEKKEY